MLKHTVNGVIRPAQMSVQDVAENHHKVSPSFIHDEGSLPLAELVGSSVSFAPTGKVHCSACLDDYVGRPGDICASCSNPLSQSGDVPHVVYLAVAQSVVIGIVPVLDARDHWVSLGASQILPIARVANQGIGERIVELSGIRSVGNVKAIEWLIGPSKDINLLAYENAVRDAIEGVFDSGACSPMYATPSYYESFRIEGMNSTQLSLNEEVKGVFLGTVGNLILLDCGYVDLIQLSGVEVDVTFESTPS